MYSHLWAKFIPRSSVRSWFNSLTPLAMSLLLQVHKLLMNSTKQNYRYLCLSHHLSSNDWDSRGQSIFSFTAQATASFFSTYTYTRTHAHTSTYYYNNYYTLYKIDYTLYTHPQTFMYIRQYPYMFTYTCTCMYMSCMCITIHH